MNAGYTRIGLDEASKESLTDWSRLRIMDEAAIETAIEADPDAYRVDAETLGHQRASYRYVIYTDASNQWRWALRSASGETVAVSGRSFPTKKALEEAIGELRDIMVGARPEAA